MEGAAENGGGGGGNGHESWEEREELHVEGSLGLSGFLVKVRNVETLKRR